MSCSYLWVIILTCVISNICTFIQYRFYKERYDALKNMYIPDAIVIENLDESVI